MPTFILNDENQVNSYGFRVKNSGISFSRFDANPVMLDSHINTTAFVLGAWENRRFDGAYLKADSKFDLAKDSAKTVSEQVDRGFVKGCSMGLAISFEDKYWSVGPDGIPELVKCELVEGSICPVPSSASSLALISLSTGKPISQLDFKLNLSAITTRGFNLNIPSQRPGAFVQVLTPDEFMNLKPKEQLDYKNNQYEAYLQTVDMLETNGRKRNFSTSPTRLTYDDIKTVDDFEKLANGDKNNFKLKYAAQYAALFNIKSSAFSLTNYIQNITEKNNSRLGAAQLSSYANIITADDFEKMGDADKLNFKNTCNAQYMALWRR